MLKLANVYSNTPIRVDWMNKNNLTLLGAVKRGMKIHAVGIVRKNAHISMVEAEQLVNVNWESWQEEVNGTHISESKREVESLD